jgi:hypothetical protein
MKLSLGVNIFNLFNIINVNNIYPETGEPDKRSEYYMKEVKLPELGEPSRDLIMMHLGCSVSLEKLMFSCGLTTNNDRII